MQNHYSPAHTHVYGPTYINMQIYCLYHNVSCLSKSLHQLLSEMKSILLVYLIHWSEAVSFQRPRKFSLAFLLAHVNFMIVNIICHVLPVLDFI